MAALQVQTFKPTDRLGVVRLGCTVVVAVGLLVDAYIHFHLAHNYDLNRTKHLSQGELFRTEGVVAIIAAAAVFFSPRRYTAAFAALVAGSAFVVLLAYRYINIKAIGPIPSMYEPIWFAEKSWSGVAELFAALAALALVGLTFVPKLTRSTED